LLVHEDPKSAEGRLSKAMDDLNRTIRDIRNYILDLRPRQLRGETLVDGLERLVAEFRQNNKMEILLASPKNEFLTDLPQTNAKALFHICQEALANIAKHAGASKVTIDLWATPDRVLLEVADNGNGFNPELISRTVGHGLANMQTRVAAVSGDLDISSIPGEGTSILAWVPRSVPTQEG
jgi:two-component system sensor histidine kinase DevS